MSRFVAASVFGSMFVLVAGCGTQGNGGSAGSGGSGGSTAAAGQGGGAGTGAAGTSPAGSSGSGGNAGTGAAGTGAAGTSGGGGNAGTGAAGRGAAGTSGSGGNAGTGAAGRGVAGTSGRGGTAGSAGGSAGSSGTGSGGASGSTGSGGASGVVPSAGCGSTAPTSGTYTIDVSGTSRQYILTLPDGYNPQHPYRLIFAFHGGSYDAQSVADGGPPGSGPYYGLASLAGSSTIFVAPQARSSSWTDQNSGDLDFVKAMVTHFESQLCVDQSRIMATGFSRGAIMTIMIGCSESNIFRAVAPMSGELPSSCPGSHEIAYWASHGMSDPTIPIAMGQASRDKFVAIDHCGTQTSAPDSNGCTAYQGCDPGYPVSWCPFAGVHEPPPFAGAAIWSFLSQF